MQLKNLIKRIDELEIKISELYLKSKDDHVSRTDNLKASLNQKKNWQKNRFKIQIGINKANRINPVKDIKKSLLNGRDN